MASSTLGLGARLMRLPGQLLLALVNATALLVIIACVLVIVVLNQVDTAGARIASTVTEATFSRLQVSPADFREKLQALDGRIETLSGQLANPDLQKDSALNFQLIELNANLRELKQAAASIRQAGPDATAAAFEQAGVMVTDALFALRGCEKGEAGAAPDS